MFDIITSFLLEIFSLNISVGAGAGAAIKTSELNYITGGDIVTRLMLIALLVFSAICWAIIIFKMILISRAKKETKLFLDIFWTSKSLDEIYKSSDNLTASPVAGVFKSGFAELEKIQKSKKRRNKKKKDENLTHMSTELEGIDNIVRSLKNAQNTEFVYLESYLPFLATTGSTTPFIGLFGTVWGLMDSFSAIATKGTTDLTAVAPGIASALVTTAAGLAAAIPAVLAYNYFFNQVKLLETEMENFSFELLNIIDRHLLTKDDDAVVNQGTKNIHSTKTRKEKIHSHTIDAKVGYQSDTFEEGEVSSNKSNNNTKKKSKKNAKK